MAASEVHRPSDDPENTFFACHKTRKCSYAVCINCGKLFHKSCAERDFAGKVIFIDSTRLTCCVKDLTSTPEVDLLKTLVKELQEKNQVLKENSSLLKEKVLHLEGELKNHKVKQNPENEKRGKSAANGSTADCHRRGTVDCQQSEASHKAESFRPNGKEITLPNMSALSVTVRPTEADVDVNEGGPVVVDSADVDAEVKPAEESENRQSDGNYGWKTVQRRKKAAEYPMQKRPQPIYGKKPTSDLEVARSPAYVFISGFKPEISEARLEEHIKGVTGIETKCLKMKTRKQDFKSSFKVEVPRDGKQKIMNPEIWGNGIVVNHFLHIRRRVVWKTPPAGIPENT